MYRLRSDWHGPVWLWFALTLCFFGVVSWDLEGFLIRSWNVDFRGVFWAQGFLRDTYHPCLMAEVIPQSYENFAHSWPKTIKILRIWQLRLVISLWHYYNTTNMIMFPRFMFASDGHCHRKTDPFGIAMGLCAKKTLRKYKFQELIRNASKSQLTTPKKQKVRANQSQPGPWQSERTNHRVLHPLKKTFAM